jgi:hypothetical protein
MNDFLRGSKGHKDYYFPSEEMMVHWLRQYCGLDESGIQAARDRRKEGRRETQELMQQLEQD